MKSIFNLALILPLAAFSIGLVGCGEPETTTTTPPATKPDADADAEPAATDEKKDEHGGSGHKE